MCILFTSRKNNHSAGVTLLEVLLYVALSTGLLLTATSLASLAVEARVKNQTIAEVEKQGAQIVQRLGQSIRNAVAITSPATSTSASSLTLEMAESAANPTVFDLNNSVVRLQTGGGVPVSLSNSRVAVSDLVFYNYSYADTPGTISFSFTVTHKNENDRYLYNFSQTFYGTASLR